MKKLTHFTKKLIKNERGQGATEYILLLVVVVGLVFIFKEKIAGIIGSKVNDLGSRIQDLK